MHFALFIRVLFVCLLGISVVVGRRVMIWVSAFGRSDQQRRQLKIIAFTVLFLLNTPALYFIILGLRMHGGTHHDWQFFFLYPYFAWQIAAIVMAVLLAATTVVKLPMRIWSWLRRPKSEPRDVDLSRRDFLSRGATAIPAGLLLTTGYGIINAQGGFNWFEHEVKLRDWPKELQGLTLMQISDLHVGSFLPGKKLAGYIEEINRRKADMLMVTGDIIDHDIAWLPECMDAMRTLRLPRYGAFVCVGNHDYYSGGAPEILAGMHKLGMTVVLDSNVTVPVRETKLNIAGLDYPMGRRNWASPGGFAGHVDRALAGVDPEAPTILLSHHPHAFDAAAARGVPLTLSGHTHGGQFAVRLPGGTISVGGLMFKYVAGLYSKSGTHVYVNRGIGNWFPMRLGAPPEVTILHLV